MMMFTEILKASPNNKASIVAFNFKLKSNFRSCLFS